MLIVRNLSSRYAKVKVLNEVSLEVKEGYILGLLGRNGAGKSTLLKSIMGLVEIVSGKETNPKDGLLQNTSSSESLDRWIPTIEAKDRNSRAKALSETPSIELAIGPSKPSRNAVLALSIGKDVHASAPEPRGHSLRRPRQSLARPRSLPIIST